MFQKLKSLASSVFALTVLAIETLTNTAAQAAEVDYTTMTSQVSFVNVGIGLLAIGVVIAGVLVVWKGVNMLLSMLKRG